MRSGLMKSLALSLVVKGKIKTTDAKARELRPMVEKLITTGRLGTVAARRNLVAQIGTIGATKIVKAAEGTLVALVGADKIKHRVTPMLEGEERIALVVSFGEPGKDYAEEGRDKFLYSDEPVDEQKVF